MKCNQCGTEFEGKFCPECGSPARNSQKPFFKRWWFLVIVIIAVIAIIASVFGDNKGKNKSL